MISSKQSINHLAYLCAHYGVIDVVFSPGSRNAPVVISFTESALFNCYSVPDERSAAFIALGMSLYSKKPTVICCTSGSAAANYAPAITEAYYAGIPLIVLTADRPAEMIDQGIGQSIRQKNMYRNFIKYSGEFIQEAKNEKDLAENDIIAQNALMQSMSDKPGPVHINLPFDEPLYDTNKDFRHQNINLIEKRTGTENEIWSPEMEEIWKKSRRKLIIYGMSDPVPAPETMLRELVNDDQVILLTETCSNLHIDAAIKTIDRVITTFEGKNEHIQPDLVISLGGPVISKKIKKLLQSFQPSYHWWIGKGQPQNTFACLTHSMYSDPYRFLKKLKRSVSTNETTYQRTWQDRNEKLKSKHKLFCRDVSYSDLKAFEIILEALPSNCVLHMANSTPVRYVQLFDQRDDVLYLANRGVSGIDGSTSTALGYSMKSKKLNILISGDLSFFYDSNAFLHDYREANLRVIIINNSGGGIFRIIEGPDSTRQLENFFEARHGFKAEHLARFYGLEYFSVHNQQELEKQISSFLDDKRKSISILEIFTDNELNPEVLKAYFEFMNT